MKLLVITLNKLNEALAVGLGANEVSRYYNPAHVADDVRLLDVHGEGEIQWPGFEHRLLPVPEDAAMSAWLASAARLAGVEHPEDGALLRGFPSLPPGWLAALREFGPDLVRGYGAGWCGFLAAEIGRALGVPSIANCHDLRGIAPETVRRATCVVAVSEAAAARCIAAGARPADVVTIFDRVNRELFSPEGTLAENAPQGNPRFLCVARDSAEKNLDRLLEACGRVSVHHPGLVLVHAGKSARDWSRWSFARHIDSIPNAELPAWYRWADWTLLPSLCEGFGIVLAESLSCGTPCITSDSAPMNEIVRNGFSGLTCDPTNVEALANVLERAITQPGLRAKLSANARAATEPYDVALVERREAALYRWLIAKERPKISVVLPTYKRAHLIERAIGVVLEQDYPNLELIVVNDGSPDATAETLVRVQRERADPRLIIVNAEHGGLPRALNAGFARASGPLWTWTSDDNAHLPGALSALARELALDANAAMIFSDYQWVNEKGIRGKQVVTGPVEELVSRNVIGLCFLYRREVAEKVGPYDADVELAEDYDYWVRIARVGKLVHVNRLLYEVGDFSDSLTRTRGDEVGAVAARVIAAQTHDPRWRDALRDHMTVLAGELKTRGLPWRSLKTAVQLIARFPLSRAGYWAFARALTPMALLRFTRRLRGSRSGT
ncbi:MAG: glycosyltransferase [Planctomycetes bacterium]|nr:glycosyltransferase [Planctomycetota bacterium]